MSPVGRGLGFGGAAKQIILPGGNGVDKPDSPLAVPLEPSEHEFRKPLLPPAPVRQGAMSAAFKVSNIKGCGSKSVYFQRIGSI